jgi:hypothetical protein
MWILACDANSEIPLLSELAIPRQDVSACSCHASTAAQQQCVRDLQSRNQNATIVGHTHHGMNAFNSAVDDAACIVQLDSGLALQGDQYIRFVAGAPRPGGNGTAATVFPVPGLGGAAGIHVRGGTFEDAEASLHVSRSVAVTTFYTTNSRAEICAVNRVRETCALCGRSEDRLVPANQVVFHVIGSCELDHAAGAALDEELAANVSFDSVWDHTYWVRSKPAGRPLAPRAPVPAVRSSPVPRAPVERVCDLYDSNRFVGTIDKSLLAEALSQVPAMRERLTDGFLEDLAEHVRRA